MTLVHVKNSIQYCIKPNGIRWIGVRGLDLSSLSCASPWQNLNTKLTLLLSPNLFIALRESWMNDLGFDVIPFLQATHKYNLSNMAITSTNSFCSNKLNRMSVIADTKESPLLPCPRDTSLPLQDPRFDFQ